MFDAFEQLPKLPRTAISLKQGLVFILIVSARTVCFMQMSMDLSILIRLSRYDEYNRVVLCPFLRFDFLVSLFGLDGANDCVYSIWHIHWPVMNTCIMRWTIGIMAVLRQP